MSILWVTSFNKVLFDASGRKLLQSFYNTKSEGDWLVGLEGPIPKNKSLNDMEIDWVNLASCKKLNGWLEKNKDISPPKPCRCKNPWARQERLHKPRCSHTWFNRNTYRWVRKFFTLRYAFTLEKEDYDYIIWVDSDCFFKQPINTKFISNVVLGESYNLVYLKGPQRQYIDAGFVAYKNCIEIKQLIERIIHYYISGDFRKSFRWDDCYALQTLAKKDKQIKVRDIGGKITGHSQVIDNSIIGQHISHKKGLHGRKLGIMK